MPFKVKFGLSLAVTLVIVAAFFHQRALGHEGPQWALLFLAPFMLVALWIFPEVTRKPIDGGATAPPGGEPRPKGM
ncbi:MAG TPA: hypothetical protein VEX11_14450 [Acetobacteraceae bacterium]|jgi:hypothetical protein|nr:hypothetical protein [Acetobacteraceae bacterium]